MTRTSLLLLACLAASRVHADAPPAWPCDLLHVRLLLDVDPAAKALAGTVELDLAMKVAASRIVLAAASSLAVEAVLERVDAPGASELPLSFKHEPPALAIELGRTAEVGAKLRLAVRYKFTGGNLGAYFVGPDAYNPDRAPQMYTQSEPYEGQNWFPGYHEPDDKATSEVSASIPRDYVAISNGELVTMKPEGARQRVHWRQDVPHSTYLIALMVGRFAKLDLGVHRGIPLTVYAQPKDAESARRSTERTGAMMAYYEELVGKAYPYPKYSQVLVSDYKWGGMEHTSATTLSDATLHDARAALDQSSDPLVAHELSHQWFGDALTCKSYAHLWLNEGFATYYEQLWAGHSRGPDRLAWSLADAGDGYLGEEDRGAQPVVRPDFKDAMTLFDSRNYNKGGRVLHMLRQILGEATFWSGMQSYVARHWFGTVDTEDLRRAMEDASKRDLSKFFRQWLYEPGYPHLKVTSAWRAGALELVIEQTQPAPQAEFTTPVDIACEIEPAPGERRRLVRRFDLVGKSCTLRWELPVEPTYVRFNEGGWLLCRVERAQSVSAWLAQLERDPDVLARREAIGALDAHKGSFVVQRALGKALESDRFELVRAQAADLLGRAGGSLAASLLAPRARDESSAVRAAVARGLAHVAAVEAEAALRALLEDQSYVVASAALASLVALNAADRPALAAKFFALDSHGDQLRKSALAAFAAIGDAAHLAKLVAATEPGGSSLAIRLEAIHHLTRLVPSHGDAVRQTLAGRLADSAHQVRGRAAAALGEVGLPNVKPLLAAMAEKDKNDTVKKVAAEAIAAIDKRYPAKPLADQITELENDAAARAGKIEAEKREIERIEGALREAKARLALEQKQAPPTPPAPPPK